MKKADAVIKLLGLAGAALTLAATFVSNYAGDKAMKQAVAEEVAKALSKK